MCRQPATRQQSPHTVFFSSLSLSLSPQLVLHLLYSLALSVTCRGTCSWSAVRRWLQILNLLEDAQQKCGRFTNTGCLLTTSIHSKLNLKTQQEFMLQSLFIWTVLILKGSNSSIGIQWSIQRIKRWWKCFHVFSYVFLVVFLSQYCYPWFPDAIFWQRPLATEEMRRNSVQKDGISYSAAISGMDGHWQFALASR